MKASIQNFITSSQEIAIGSAFSIPLSLLFIGAIMSLDELAGLKGSLIHNQWLWLWAGSAGGFVFGRHMGREEKAKAE